MMHCAVAADNTEMVKLLLKFKPDLEIGVSAAFTIKRV